MANAKKRTNLCPCWSPDRQGKLFVLAAAGWRGRQQVTELVKFVTKTLVRILGSTAMLPLKR